MPLYALNSVVTYSLSWTGPVFLRNLSSEEEHSKVIDLSTLCVIIVQNSPWVLSNDNDQHDLVLTHLERKSDAGCSDNHWLIGPANLSGSFQTQQQRLPYPPLPPVSNSKPKSAWLLLRHSNSIILTDSDWIFLSVRMFKMKVVVLSC